MYMPETTKGTTVCIETKLLYMLLTSMRLMSNDQHWRHFVPLKTAKDM